MLCALTPEEDGLLDLLEGKQPADMDRLRVLVDQLIVRHWDDLLTYIRKRCFHDSISAEQITADTFCKAYEMFAQQMAQLSQGSLAGSPMRYSRAHCPQFLGFVKALSRWKHVDAARKIRRYGTAIDTLTRQLRFREAQHGTLRSRMNGARMPLRKTAPADDTPTAIWELVSQLPRREHLVVRLYFQHGPEPLNLPHFAELATGAGLKTQEVRTLQRRFRSLLRKQKAMSTCHLTQDMIAEVFDVERETIRRSLVKAGQHLQAALHDMEA